MLASPAATRPSSLKPALRALFCATHSDWERFDEIFDAFWQGRDMRQRQVLRARRAAARRRRGGSAQAHVPQEALGLPDHVERRSDGDGDAPADGRGRREGASRAEALTTTDLRHIVDPDDMAATHALAARLARVMRARLVRREQVRRRGRRLDLRRTIHRNVSHGGTPDRPGLAAPQDQAAAARRAARRLGLDEPLHRVLRPLPAWRRRQLPRGGSLRLPHPARARLAVAARPRRDARGRQARPDGARHRRRHAHRREPRHVQSLARAARDQFAHRGDDRLRRL